MLFFFLVQNFFQHFSKMFNIIYTSRRQKKKERKKNIQPKKNLCGVERIDDDDEEAKEQQVGKKCWRKWEEKKTTREILPRFLSQT